MKSIKYIIIIFIGILSLPACSEFLDKEPDTELTLSMVFEDRMRMEGWLANIYSAIPRPTWDYLKDGAGWDVLGDELSPSYLWYLYGWDFIPRIVGEWSPISNLPNKADYWDQLPERLRTAYIFMENVKAIPSQGITEQEVELMKAECRFLVAYYHYLLVNTYGAIPFQPYVITPTNYNLDDLKYMQAPYDEVIAWIDNELTETAKILPPKYDAANKYGRATSIMCLAVRARMLLFAASDLVNGNADYDGYANKEGTPIFNSAKSTEKWTLAATACKDLIDAAHAAGHGLYIETNENGDIDPFMSYQNLFLNEANKGNIEILFANPQRANGEYEAHSAPRSVDGNGGLGVTQRLVDAFFMKNGLPPILDYNPDGSPQINAASGYSETNFSSINDVRPTNWNGCKPGGIITETGTYNMYCNREPRFYISVFYNDAYYPINSSKMDFFYGHKDNPTNSRHDTPQNGYLARKKVDPRSNRQQGYSIYRPDILFRLGEAYLNYAEALNESLERDPDVVLEYLNKIRERAGVRPYTTGAEDADHIHVDDSREAMRDIIRRERNVELCCEGLRYDDLRRWKKAEGLLNGPFYGMNAASGTEAATFYIRVPYLTRVYRKQFYWFPIHQVYLDKNENLVQTPYWN
jgi:hypothetical protein